MRFRILGPLAVEARDGRRLSMGPRESRVLATLLLAANRVVAVHELIDAGWDDRPPRTARRQIQNAVWILRRDLPVVTDGPGYRIDVGPGELDAAAFRHLCAASRGSVAAGHPARAVEQLRAALALWRGPACAGCAGRAVRTGADRLDEERLTATEQCLDLELDLRRHAEVVGELAALVGANPLRERLVGQLMVALYRSGRRAEALKVYQDLRSRLGDDLGIDPGTELRQRYVAVLRDEIDPPTSLPASPVSAPDPVVPRQLPAPVRHFVARSAELKQLTDLIEEPGDTVVVAAVGGTAGVGKTALVIQWAHLVAERFPDGQLYVNLRGFDPTGPPVHPADAVRGFIDAFGVAAARIPVDPDAQVTLYRSLIAGRRMLVVLDNACDVAQVRPLLPGTSGCLALVTSRNQLDGLVAVEGAHPVTLDTFTTAEARDMLARHLGRERLAADPAAVDALIEHCARLPLALAVVAARSAIQPSFPLATFVDELADAQHRLDSLVSDDETVQVRAVFSWSYQRLSGPAARLFRLLGLHPGPDITVAAAASLGGRPVAETRRHVAELTRTHLLVQHVPGRYLHHDLLRAYAAELAATVDTDAERRAAVERMLDHYLHVAFAASRWIQTQRTPITLAPPAPGVGTEVLSDRDAARAWFDTERAVLFAVIGCAEGGFDTHVWQLAWTLIDALMLGGHWHDLIAVQRLAVAAAQRLGDQTAQAVARRYLGRGCEWLGRDDEMHEHLRHALTLYEAVGDHRGQGNVHHDLTHALWHRKKFPEALDQAEQALTQARKAGSSTDEADALNAIGQLHANLGDPGRGQPYCELALRIDQRAGNRFGQAATFDSLGFIHDRLGDHDLAVRCYQEAIDRYREVDARYGLAETLDHLGDTHRSAGRPDEARVAWEESLAILVHIGHPDAAAVRAKLLDAL